MPGSLEQSEHIGACYPVEQGEMVNEKLSLSQLPSSSSAGLVLLVF